MATVEEENPDLAHTFWQWPEQIATNPAKALANADLAFDYFAFSPFFDVKSNNGVLRTQRRVENPTYGHAEEKYELNAFRSGFEYIVSHALPPRAFIIQRRDVSEDGSRENNVTASFLILDDKVYSSPTVYDVMSAHLKTASHLITNTFRSLSEARPSSNPRALPSWRSLPPSAAPAAPSASANTNAEASSSRLPGAVNSDGDVSMGASPAPPDPSSTEPAPPAKPTSDTAEVQQPDWNLFHALSSTRAALPGLEEASRRPAKAIDPREELRAMEAASFPSSASAAGDARRAGPRSTAGGSLVPPVRTWSDPSLSNVPTAPRGLGGGSIASAISPRPIVSTPGGISPAPRA